MIRTFIKKFGADTVFDPQAVTVLVDAFDDAWRSVRASGAELAAAKYAPMARELLAKHIIVAAKRGSPIKDSYLKRRSFDWANPI